MTKEVTKRKRVKTAFKKLSQQREVPKSLFVLIILLYFIATIFLKKSARISNQPITFFGYPTTVGAFTGVFAYASNVCLIFLVVFYKKIGFITSTIILIASLPSLILSIVHSGRMDNIAGVFSTVFTVGITSLLLLNSRRVERYQKRIQEQAVTDGLTGLPNWFALSNLMELLVKKGEPFALISADLNDFKSINDTMGHDIGNLVLIEIADRWKTIADTGLSGTDDFVARVSGDQFAILVHAYKTDDDIMDAIRIYREALERKITVNECDYYMKACFGYAEYPADAETAGEMSSCADAAMHEAKRIGGANSIVRFSPELLESEQTFEIERKIRAALEGDGIRCYLQPQYTIDHKLRGFEALARLVDADGKMISPVDFIPIAEKTGLIDQVDLKVFRQAMEFLGTACKKNPDILVSVNVSVRHLMKNNFIEEIKETLVKHQVPFKNLEIEITESIMIDSAGKATTTLDEVEKLGIKIAIDDFGTGYSSLSYLNDLPASLLKIDKSFIDVMNTSDSSKKYVAAIVSIGHILNMEVISEGVESEEQLETLRSVGCDFIQGYIWGKPMPLSDAGKLVD